MMSDPHQYSYDPGNQRTNTTRLDGSTVGFAYDKIGQLKVAAASVPSENRGYVYDADWNLNWRTNNGSLLQFVVTNNNELVTVNGFPVRYDANGNHITNASDSYFYDDENQLTQVSDETYHTFRSDFVYDGLGRLRQRLEYYWQNSQSPLAPLGGSWTLSNTVAYIYDGNRVIQDQPSPRIRGWRSYACLRLSLVSGHRANPGYGVAGRDGSNTPTTAYTRGPDLSGSLEGAGGIGGLLARSSGYSGGNWASHAYYHGDGGGNITFMLDGNQGTVASYRYDPYGNLISKSGSLADANVYRFSSKEIHVHSGMYYYGYRFYDPNLQRWINRDPIEEAGGVNLYQFVGNDPVSIMDPYGLIWPFPSSDISQAEWDRLNAIYGAKPYDLDDQVNNACKVGGLNTPGQWYQAADLSKEVGVTAATGAAMPEIKGVQVIATAGRLRQIERLEEAAAAFRGERNFQRVEKVKGPDFPNLRSHARDHSELPTNAYYNQAVQNTQCGTKFKFYHEGQFKNAYVTRLGPDNFRFTSTSLNGKTIFTHYEVDTQYLRNLGITLPEGF